MITLDPPSSPFAELPTLSRSGLSRFLNRARTAVGIAGQVDVLLTSDAEIKRLNRVFRRRNKATDILSFPTPAEIADHHAGDLAISLDTAALQAAEHGHALGDELRILLLHGLLHLDGEDHETDDGRMAARELALRKSLRLRPTTLIERAQQPLGKQPHPARPLVSKPRATKPRASKPRTTKPRATRPRLGSRP